MTILHNALKAYSTALPVGTQRHYTNSREALASIIREEGLIGLLRGVNAAVLRTAMGSSVSQWTANLFVNINKATGSNPCIHLVQDTTHQECRI
jgi:solute carrier family 25, member 34/35